MMGTGQSGRRLRRKAGRRTCRLQCEMFECRLLLTTYTVTSTSDALTTGGAPTPNTLRWAIEQVDSDSTPDEIQFNISGRGVHSIQILGQPLPVITTPVVIDGTSQPSYTGTPLIQIDGSMLSGTNDGLVISGGGSTIKGLAIVGFSGSGLVLNSLGGNVVAADYLGVPASSTQVNGDGTGLSITGSSDNTIGGSTAGSGNVISGNTDDGILINASSGPAADNAILANLIGTTPSGKGAMGNGQSGIAIVGASGNEIGFPALGLGNVISGNLGAGIAVNSGASGTLIQNDAIGVTADGDTAIGNGGDGILLDDAPQTLIGGGGQYESNEIGANAGNGINTSGDTTGLLVEGNFIGTNSTATQNLGNYQNGIQLGSSSNTIGGTLAGAGNTIDDNGVGQVAAGVQLIGAVNQNEILSNSIYQNDGLGINFGNGPTPNNPPGTPGPNDYQNYPVLSVAQSDGSTTTIQGTLYSIPNTQFLIQFFSSPSAALSDFGQGKLLIGTQSVQTDADDNATFTVTFPTAALVGQFISATATDPAGNTSEFARDITVQGQINVSLAAAATPDPVLAGGTLTYTLTVSNQGSEPAEDVVLTDHLPGSVSRVSTTTSQGGLASMSAGAVVADLGTIAAGGAATVTIVVTTSANSPSAIVDSASVTCQQTDPTPASLSATLTTTVLSSSDLSVVLSPSSNTVLVGSDLTYTMAVTNLGPDEADDATATLPLPSGVSFVSATTSVGTVSDTDGQVVADLDDLAENASASVQMVVQTETAGELTATATVASDSQDPVPSNNSSTATTEVDPASDLGVSVTASSSPIASNHEFDYVVTVTTQVPATTAASW